jgi:dinuclear metal center YbgI/SA1388 family protein
MVPKLDDICQALEGIAPTGLAESWDNPGLQVGEFSKKVDRILISLDPTMDALREASCRKAQVLITHHPLIFASLSSIRPERYPGCVIFEAIRRGIAIVAVHTNLDLAIGGINDKLADLLGLRDVGVLIEKEGWSVQNTGLGRIGDLVDPLPLSNIVQRVKKILGIETVRVLGDGNKRMSRVAVVGGSGAGTIATSAEKGADLLVTGDVRHHQAMEAGILGLALIDGGHFYTERAALRFFAKDLRSAFKYKGWNVSVEVFEDERDPFRYE